MSSPGDKEYEHQFEGGRRFHGVKDSKYGLPNDIDEMDRLHTQHLLWAEYLDGLLLAPLSPDITTALDIGCGSGLWAIDFAKAFPQCHVTGTDLSPIQPSEHPPNVSFKIENAQQPWSFVPESLDYVHTRAITLGITDWDPIYAEAYKALKPGGWIELQELCIPFLCDNGTESDAPALQKWNQGMQTACSKLGIDTLSALHHESNLKKSGFRDVQTRDIKGIFGPWPEDERLKRLGVIGRYDVEKLLPGTVKLLTMAGWEKAGLDELFPQILDELDSGKVKAYIPLKVFWGQKPL